MDLRGAILTGEQIRAGRALARLDQTDLARLAGVSLETIKRLERTRGQVEANIRTLVAISDTFRGLGVCFDLQSGEGPGVRLVSIAALPGSRAA